MRDPRVFSSVLLLAAWSCASCARPDRASASLPGQRTVHLEEHLATATTSGGSAPLAPAQPRTWRFDEARPEWRTLSSDTNPQLASVALEQQKDGVRMALGWPKRPGFLVIGGLAVDLEGAVQDWEAVLVRARSHDRFAGITVTYNVDEARALPEPLRAS